MTTVSDLQTLKGIVYLIRNSVNGMLYVGKTERTFWKRYSAGKWWIKSDNLLLRQAALEFGHNNFSIEIIEHGLSQQDLISREIEYIDRLVSIYPKGYNKVRNSSLGLSGACEYTRKLIGEAQKRIWASKSADQRIRGPMSQETKDLLSRIKTGTKASEETRRKMSLSKRGEKHPQYGKRRQIQPHSLETREKIGSATRSRGKGNNCNIVLQLDGPISRKIIREFASPEEVSVTLGISVENIYSCCRHKGGQKTANGFVLEYKNKPNKNNKRILQIDIDTNKILCEFTNAPEAARYVGVKAVGNIHAVCRGHKHTCGGFKWKYK